VFGKPCGSGSCGGGTVKWARVSAGGSDSELVLDNARGGGGGGTVKWAGVSTGRGGGGLCAVGLQYGATGMAQWDGADETMLR